MTWETPKTDWVTSDGIGYADMNRIESNTLGVRNATVRKIQGGGYLIYNNVSGYDGIVAIQPLSCYSAGGFPIRQNTEFRKNLNTWALGSGDDKGGMASAVTPAGRTWYYIYAILNTSSGAIDFMFDDDPGGANIPVGTFDEKRYIGAFKTRDAGAESSFFISEMYSIGDRTFINPNDMVADRDIVYTNINNQYKLVSLSYVLPERLVLAQLNVYSEANKAIGFISNYGGFTVPSGIYASFPSRPPLGEVIFTRDAPVGATPNLLTCGGDFPLMVDTDRQIYAALYDTGIIDKIYIGVRGWHDERLI